MVEERESQMDLAELHMQKVSVPHQNHTQGGLVPAFEHHNRHIPGRQA